MRVDVVPIAEARADLSRVLRRFRDDPDAESVVIGSHRVPEAVLVPFAAYRSQQRVASVPFRERVHLRRGIVERLAYASRIRAVRVFGSIARGDDDESSDLDLLVVPESDATLFDLARFEMDMETLFERSVDVVSERSLDPIRDAAILAEAREL